MRSLAHEIALHLDHVGAGAMDAVTGWSLGVAVEPPAPPGSETAITLYDTGGPGPDTDELDLRRQTFQVRVRGNDYPAAYAKQQEISALLILPSGPQLIGESDFAGIVMTSDIIAIGRDDKNRHLLTANYLAIRTERE